MRFKKSSRPETRLEQQPKTVYKTAKTVTTGELFAIIFSLSNREFEYLIKARKQQHKRQLGTFIVETVYDDNGGCTTEVTKTPF